MSPLKKVLILGILSVLLNGCTASGSFHAGPLKGNGALNATSWGPSKVTEGGFAEDYDRNLLPGVFVNESRLMEKDIYLFSKNNLGIWKPYRGTAKIKMPTGWTTVQRLESIHLYGSLVQRASIRTRKNGIVHEREFNAGGHLGKRGQQRWATTLFLSLPDGEYKLKVIQHVNGKIKKDPQTMGLRIRQNMRTAVINESGQGRVRWVKYF